MLADNVLMNLLGPYVNSQELLEERNEIIGYYNFYQGEAKGALAVQNKYTKGQSWSVNEDLDYKPSQDIRNFTKKLINRQSRFMFGKTPDIIIKAIDQNDKKLADQKRQLIDKIFEDNQFWSDTKKADIDKTVGKRVLLRVEANPGEDIKIFYHPSDEFTFKVDPSDYKKLTEVIIAYKDISTQNQTLENQKWYRYRYYIQNNICYLDSGVYDGRMTPINGEEEIGVNTGLDEVPCYVVINDALLGDTFGSSDVKELVDLQNVYNHTLSDARDTLKFNMFGQLVIKNADEITKESLKVAPNAVIDLHTDPSLDGKADCDVKRVEGQFMYSEPLKNFVDSTKSDMYELMDQPKPEDVKTVPSAKALKFTFYELIARCEDKWQAWEPAFKWLINFMFKCIDKFDLYSELDGKMLSTISTTIVIKHNYPIPEDEEDKKTVANEEVKNKTKSILEYIKEFSDVEDAEGEYERILKETAEMQQAMQSDSFQNGISSELDNPINR